MEYMTDIEIAQACQKERIGAVAERAGIPEEYLELYGNYKAKVDYKFLRDSADKPRREAHPGHGHHPPHRPARARRPPASA